MQGVVVDSAANFTMSPSLYSFVSIVRSNDDFNEKGESKTWTSRLVKLREKEYRKKGRSLYWLLIQKSKSTRASTSRREGI
jgi:hypothetical protein